MHLEIAELIRSSDRLSEPSKNYLDQEFPAFYLGSVTPDFQTVANLRRDETHFYSVPPKSKAEGYETMLKRFPQLAKPSNIPIDQAVFIAGYCAHLMLDLRWYHKVLLPFFIENENWASRRRAFLVHNTLLTYLDKSAFEGLPTDASTILSFAAPKNWLPFAADSDLVKWRDHLVEQLKPGAMLQTVEVYARRMGMSSIEFEANLHKSDWMERHLFSKVPMSEVKTIFVSAVDDSIDLIGRYFALI